MKIAQAVSEKKTFLFMIWSNLCPSCCDNTGRLLHGICKYVGEELWPMGLLFQSYSYFEDLSICNGNMVKKKRCKMSVAETRGINR